MKELLPYFHYLKAFKWPYLFGLLSGVIYGASSGFGMAFVTAKLLPFLLSKENAGSWFLLGAVLLLPAIAIIRAVSGFFSSYLMVFCDHKIWMQMQIELMEFLQGMGMSFYHKNRTGNVMARVINDTKRISNVVTRCSSDLVKQPVTIIGAFFVIMYLSYQRKEAFFLVVALLLLPVCLFPIRRIGKRITNQEKQLGESEGSLHSIVQESFASARETRAFNLHEKEMAHFRSKADFQARVALRIYGYGNLVSPLVEVITAVGVAGAVFYAVKAELELEAILPLLVALYMCYKPVKSLGRVYAEIQKAVLAVERIDRMYGSGERLEEPDNPMPLTPIRSSIEFKSVTFAYDSKPALRDVSISIAKGEVVALVGPSGAGKSTFTHLLGRFYDPDEGRVLIDGISLRSVREQEVRSQMSFVPQDSFLFADTIMNNIRVGRGDANDEEVIDAAIKANAHDFIERLASGYDTVVSERGASLSGGQRQRIAIARAFLKNADILILDEPTSALDSESEQHLKDALQRLVRNKTVFIVAHRHSTICMASRVLQFQEGRVVADSTVSEWKSASSELFADLSRGTATLLESHKGRCRNDREGLV